MFLSLIQAHPEGRLCTKQSLCGEQPHNRCYVASSVMWRTADFLGTPRDLTQLNAT